jgi:hypothetical protein
MLAADPSPAAVAEAGEEVWLYRDVNENDFSDWNRRRSLRELDEEFQAKSEKDEFYIQAEIYAAHCVERPWLRLVRVVRPGHRDREFMAEVVERSPLAPQLAPGETFRLSMYEIENWKHVDGDTTTFGRGPTNEATTK